MKLLFALAVSIVAAVTVSHLLASATRTLTQLTAFQAAPRNA